MDPNASGDHPQTVFGFPLPPFSVGVGVGDQQGPSISSQSASPAKSSPTQKRRSTSGIPKLNKKQFSSAKSVSVIYGSSAHHKNGLSSQQTLSQFKSPWVPAPGLASASTSTQTHNRVKKVAVSSNKSTNQVINGSAPHLASGLIKSYEPTHSTKDVVDVAADMASNLSNASAASFPIHYRRKTRIRKVPSWSSSKSRDRKKGQGQLYSSLKDEERLLTKEKRGQFGKSSYTLKSNDSLLDVTSFLACKRDELQSLWEHCLAEGEHPELLTIFENANRLATEAVSEVENLRQSIARLHKKETSLSEGDCEELDQLRQRVLSKIKDFEQINSKVQNEVVAVATTIPSPGSGLPNNSPRSKDNSPLISKSSGISRHPKAKYSKSYTDIHNPHVQTVTDNDSPRVDDDDLFFIKEQHQAFNNFLPSESSTDIEQNFRETSHQPILAKATFSKSHTTATTVPSSTILDLSKLTRMYNEGMELPPVSSQSKNFNQNKNVRFHERREQQIVEVETLQNQLTNLIQHLKINEQQNLQKPSHNKIHTSGSDSESTIINDTPEESTIYRNKVLKLQRKMNDAEAEMEELKEDLERVESESNFKVRLLKSTFEDRLENLEQFPEYLHIPDMRLVETIQSKTELEKVVKCQDKEMNKLQTANADLKEKLDKTKHEMKGVENSLHKKLKELEKANEGLSAELSHKNEEVIKLSQKLSTSLLKPTSSLSRTFSSIHQNLNESPEMAQMLLRKNQKLEAKVEELRDRLAKANKNVHILQVTKEKMQSRLNQRQEELMAELDESRARNRQLQNQIHYIRTTYHDLFPREAFYHKKAPTGDPVDVQKRLQTPSKNKDSANVSVTKEAGIPRSPRQKSSKSSKVGNSQPQKITHFELPMSQSKTWVTGQKAGGSTDKGKDGEFYSNESTDVEKTANPNDDVNQKDGGASTTVSELEDPSES